MSRRLRRLVSSQCNLGPATTETGLVVVVVVVAVAVAVLWEDQNSSSGRQSCLGIKRFRQSKALYYKRGKSRKTSMMLWAAVKTN